MDISTKDADGAGVIIPPWFILENLVGVGDEARSAHLRMATRSGA